MEGTRLSGERAGRFKWAVVSLVFIIFAAYFTYIGYARVQNGGVLGGDQTNIGLMLMSQSRPDLFARDHMFSSDYSMNTFYTPFYLLLLRQIIPLAGSYEMSLVFLSPVLTLLYLAGMFALLFRVTRDSFVALSLSLVSAFRLRSASATFWGVVGVETVVPRTTYLAFAPWLFLLLLHYLDDRRLPLVAFLAGLAANLHPVSGFVFVQMLLAFIILELGLNRKGVLTLLLSALAAVCGVLPTLVNYIGQTEGRGMSVPFEVFYKVVDWRMYTVFPGSNFSRYIGLPLDIGGQIAFTLLYSLGIVLWVVLFLRSRGLSKISGDFVGANSRWRFFGNSRRLEAAPTGASPKILDAPRSRRARWLYAALFALQVPLVIFLTGRRGMVLLMAAIFYVACRLREGEPDRMDRHILSLVALVGVLALVVSLVAYVFWRGLQIWQLTTIVGEQSRLARFVYLPLFLYAARFLVMVKSWSAVRWRGIALVAALAILLPSRSFLWAGLVGALLYALPPERLRGSRWGEGAQGAVAIAVAVAAFCFLFRVPFAPLWSSFAAAMYGIFKLVGRLPTPYRRAAAGSVLAVALILVPWFAFGRQGDGPSSELVSRSGSAFRASLDRLLLQNVWTVSPQQRDSLELYRWARTQTDTGSLFFVYTDRDGDNAPLAFRYYTQRSATCSYKDMGQAYYTRYRMVELFHCYSEFKEAAHDPGQLLSLLTKYGVDYAVIPVAQAQVGAIAPPLEVVFENETYRVFAVRT